MNVKLFVIQKLKASQGDDYARAMAEFSRLTPAEMALEHGHSGYSRQEVLNDFRRRHLEHAAAIAWVNSQPEPK